MSDGVAGIPPLHPQELVRATEQNGKRYFGYRHSQLDVLSRRGLIPAPFEPYPGAKFSFWTGEQILAHQAARIAAAQAEFSTLSENSSSEVPTLPERSTEFGAQKRPLKRVSAGAAK